MTTSLESTKICCQSHKQFGVKNIKLMGETFFLESQVSKWTLAMFASLSGLCLVNNIAHPRINSKKKWYIYQPKRLRLYITDIGYCQ